MRRTLAGGAAVTAVTLAAAFGAQGTAAAQLFPAPEAPTLDTTVDGNTVTIHLLDPNRGIQHALTVCTAMIINPVNAIPLLPSLAAGELPPISDLDPAMFQWGPALNTTNSLARERTWVVEDVPSGIFVVVGVCTNPNVTATAPTIEPLFVGGPLGVGSSALDLGSAVADTPGAFGAILTLLGIDTGSLGSSDDGGSSGSSGSGDGSSFGSGDDGAVGSGDSGSSGS